MFIRETRKIDRVTKKEYCFYQLIESIRTERGPRQRILLNLGSELGIEKEQFKDLANRIEEIYCNQTSLIPYSDEIENLAKKFSKMLVRQQMQPATIGATSLWSHADYTSVDIESLSNEDCRTVGVEYILYKTLSKLGLPKKFTEIGFSLSQSNTAIASVIARAAFPASERSSHNWLQHHSALDELIGTDFKTLSLNKFYEVSDLLLENKKAIEDHLTTASKVLFNLQEKIILYDLTNTYFEGLCENNKKAKRGKSKQKRSDSPLVAMGLVLDAEGFPKRSDMFEGNVAETKTFQKMILSLHSTEYLFKPIIVMDAGIASEDNVNWLKDHKYPYVVVFRKKTQTMPLDGSRIIVKDKEGERVTAITKKK